MTISIKPTASGSTIEQDGSTILTVDSSGNIDVANNLTVTGSSPAPTGPAFSVYANANTAMTSSVHTKIPFNAELFDTNSNFDSTTNYRFTPTVAGYYQLNAAAYVYSSGSTSARFISLYKNGSLYQRGISFVSSPATDTISTYSGLVYLNGTTDYVEIYVYDNGTSPFIYGNSTNYHVWFSGCLTRAA